MTDEVVRFVLSTKLLDIPPDAREVARRALLDALACGVGARDSRVARAVRGFVLEEGTAPRACLWGTPDRASASRAALANGTAAHALDYDDVSWAMNGHPSAPLLPAVLAVAESRGTSGARALVAYVVGVEIAARLGQAMGRSHYARGWHPTATLGTLGAAAAVGKLLELDEDAMRRALGIACSAMAGSRMNFGTDAKPLHAGFAAELAARGASARSDPLDAEMGPFDLYDGERPGAPLALGEPFALLDPGLELKPYPSCRFTHRAIDAVLAIRQRRPNGLPRRIVCAVDPFALKILIHPRPVDGLQAKFSLPYCAAVAWIDGWPKVGSFEDSRARRGDVQELLARVEVREASGEEDEVTILFESGEEDRERVRLARGNPARPLDREEHLRKVRNLCDPVLGPDGTRAVVDGVDRLEDLPKIGELCAALATGGSR